MYDTWCRRKVRVYVLGDRQSGLDRTICVQEGLIMTRRFGRRRFLGSAAGAAFLGSVSGGEETSAADRPAGRQVRLEFLRPKEIEDAQAASGTIFQPLGTIEWHGVHNVVGVDSLKAHALCVRAAQRGGGVVSPALYGGVGGLSQPHTFVMEPENSVFSNQLRPWLDRRAVPVGQSRRLYRV